MIDMMRGHECGRTFAVTREVNDELLVTIAGQGVRTVEMYHVCTYV